TRAVDAFRIAERVRAHISQLPIYAGGGTDAERVPVTVSIGVAALDAGSRRELTELLAAADAALYRAKASGRDQVQMISTSRGLSAVRPADGQSVGAASTFSEGPLPAEVAADGNGSSGNGASGTADHGIEKDGEAEPDAARQLPVDGSAHSATTSALPV
ncbi:MAG TPA: diguanylate cyclase, partial [Trebonia sp.]